MKAIKLLALMGLLASCQSPESPAENTMPKQPEGKTASTTYCYAYVTAADTIRLKLLHAGETVAGTLVYKLKEKDSNTGNIQGIMKGNLLVADYTFMSEGVESTRQVVFRLEGNAFVEGYGETVEQNGKTRFKNLSDLRFTPAIKLTEAPCQ